MAASGPWPSRSSTPASAIRRPRPSSRATGRCRTASPSWRHWRRPGRGCAGRRPRERNIAIVLANYPARDGRLANGVGLDVPASCIEVLSALGEAGYAVADAPADGAELVARLAAGPTNELAGRAQPRHRRRRCRSPTMAALFEAARRGPGAGRRSVGGRRNADPHLAGDAFALSVLVMGRVVVGLQPARGYHIDPDATYHSPDLAPPHGYLAFYLWLRHRFGAHAVVQLGKHGNLEWLPGKATALSAACLPEAVLGPLPQLYPFIVNDPGEGTQAKRAHGSGDRRSPHPAHDPGRELGRARRARGPGRRAPGGGSPRPAPPGAPARARSSSGATPWASPRDLGLEPGDRLPSSSPGSTTTCARSRSCRSATGCTCSAARPRVGSSPICWSPWRAHRAGAAGGELRCCARWRPISGSAGIRSAPRLGEPWAGPRPARARRPWPLADPGRHGRAPGAPRPPAGRGRGRARPRLGGHACRAAARSTGGCGPRSAPVARPRSRACSPASPGGGCRPAPAARRPAAGPRCCRPAATSTRSTAAPCRRRRLAARLALGRAGGRAVSAAPRHLAAAGGAVRLGHRQHAHRRRRHRPGAGAARLPPALGHRQPARDRRRGAAAGRARSPARRRDLARLRLLPRRLPGPDRAARRRLPGGGRPGRARGRQPAGGGGTGRRGAAGGRRVSRPKPPADAPAPGSSAASPAPTAPACRR